MTTDVIDCALHVSSFPTTYTGPGTLIGNVYMLTDSDGVGGHFTSDGNAVQINNGFLPSEIEIFNTTDGITWRQLAGMPAANSEKFVLGGSLAGTQDTGSAITVQPDYAPGNVASVLLSATLCGTSKNIVFRIVK